MIRLIRMTQPGARTMTSVADLQRLSAQKLSDLLLKEPASSPEESKLAVVDVRDSDHIGGHIKGSMHVPSGNLDAMLPTLVRKLEGKETIVFHCALSQQRGPGAALRYIRARNQVQGRTSSGGEAGDKESAPAQKVYVLDRGFVGWQELYGEDERLTEGYVKDIWQDGYLS